MYIIRYVVNSPGDLRTGGASRATPHPAPRALEPLASRARSTRRNAPHPAAPDNAHKPNCPERTERTNMLWVGGRERARAVQSRLRSSQLASAPCSEIRQRQDTTLAGELHTAPSIHTPSVMPLPAGLPESPNRKDPRAAPIARPRVSCKSASVSSTPPPVTLSCGPCRVPRHAISVGARLEQWGHQETQTGFWRRSCVANPFHRQSLNRRNTGRSSGFNMVMCRARLFHPDSAVRVRNDLLRWIMGYSSLTRMGWELTRAVHE